MPPDFQRWMSPLCHRLADTAQPFAQQIPQRAEVERRGGHFQPSPDLTRPMGLRSSKVEITDLDPPLFKCSNLAVCG